MLQDCRKNAARMPHECRINTKTAPRAGTISNLAGPNNTHQFNSNPDTLTGNSCPTGNTHLTGISTPAGTTCLTGNSQAPL